ncbi:MAG: IS30 family transposase [Bacillota bacterium]|nr:IS30 family transposase [Bacillota bacterium]
MSKEVRGNQRHMTMDDRIYIEQALEKGIAFKDIGKFLRKDPTTISKEVKKHRMLKPRNIYGKYNSCKLRQSCNHKDVCGKNGKCNKRCASCLQCNSNCPDYVQDVCAKLNHAPFVCNGCEKKVHCKVDKYFYRSTTAHSHYRNSLSTSRQGINLTPEALSELDSLVSPLILKGQSVAHIYIGHKEEIPCSSRSLYNYVDNNILSVRNLDLPRRVKYKPRKKKKASQSDPAWREGRKYSDFLAFIEKNPDVSVVEMDTVEGLKGGKVLLTLLFRSTRCMLIFLLPDKSQSSVIKIFNQLEKSLGTLLFKRVFSVILTDNGSEFINPVLLETGKDSLLRTNIYYCDPNASYQKGALEKNHEYIRYVLPKGTSFDELTQGGVKLLMNHINSTARASLNGRTPFELASLLLDQMVIDVLGLQKIGHDNVLLKPSLLKRK